MKTLRLILHILIIQFVIAPVSVSIAHEQNFSIEALKQRADQNNVEAIFGLGEIFSGIKWYGFEGENTKDVNLNYKEAVKWYIKAAELGHAESQYRLALLFVTGRGTEGNEREILKWINKAVESNHWETKILLGKIYYEGLHVEKNFEKARKLYIEGMKQQTILGDDGADAAIIYSYIVEAVMRLTDIYYNGRGVKQDYVEALKWISMLHYTQEAQKSFQEILKLVLDMARHGDIKAQKGLGDMYFNFALEEGNVARNNPDDIKQAEKWYQKPVKQGYTEAQRKLGFIYCRRDKKQEGMKLYRMAAEKENTEAQWELGQMFFLGYECSDKEDYKEAVKWYSRAAELGHIQAQFVLGSLYFVDSRYLKDRQSFKVKVLEQDISQAIKWLTKSAEQGYGEAQLQLGAIYAELYVINKSDTRSRELALKWCQKAAEKGYECDKQIIEDLK
ncbi:MAG: sel1 repeat family protein [Betaproteobacteria bacterium]|nr:sel1 repeat family protein [Betaproteobacteria bacterium]